MNRRPPVKTFLLLLAVALGALTLAGPAAADPAPTGWTWDDAPALTSAPTGWTWDD